MFFIINRSIHKNNKFAGWFVTYFFQGDGANHLADFMGGFNELVKRGWWFFRCRRYIGHEGESAVWVHILSVLCVMVYVPGFIVHCKDGRPKGSEVMFSKQTTANFMLQGPAGGQPQKTDTPK